MARYRKLKKIDAHMHYNSARPALLNRAESEGFSLLSINTEVPFFPSITEQETIVLDQQAEKDHRLAHVTTFSTENWGKSGWPQEALEQIKEGIANGAAGVKVWKNIGMSLQDEEGNFVMIDHPSFDLLFEYCERQGIPVLGHLGEPKNCWLPQEEMTVKSDREYFAEHPEYHMYKHPEYPSYEQQIKSRDNRLEKHPGLRFIGAHLASLEWSVDRVARWLDRFPNAAVDLAERICHLQYQAVSDWQKVRNFVHEYQDRIIYGTDMIDDGGRAAGDIQRTITEKWHMHWKFFSQDEIMSVPKVEKSFRGLNLQNEVLSKIFRENALQWYPALKRSGARHNF